MYSLEVIIALNEGRTSPPQDKTESRREFWRKQMCTPVPRTGLRDEAREVVALYQGAPRLSAIEQLALAFALALLEHGVDGPRVFPVRTQR